MTDWLQQTLQRFESSRSDQELLENLKLNSDQIRRLSIEHRAVMLENVAHTVGRFPKSCDFVLSQFAATTSEIGGKKGGISPALIMSVDSKMAPSDVSRVHLLQMLVRQGNPDDLALFADLLTTTPPESQEPAIQSLAVLMQRKDLQPTPLFPKLLDGLQNNVIAGVVLDFLNFLVRSGRIEKHPAAERSKSLVDLLGLLVGQLGVHEDLIQSNPTPQPNSSRNVSETISLVISLCDALSLMGESTARGKIYQVMQLSHRRLRVEAAAALVRLNEESAIQTLVELAAEPLVRLRALTYAAELGISDQIDEKYSRPQARAEAELTLLLSEPTHFGFPPHLVEVIDERTQYWPGFDDRVQCFLLRYTYTLEPLEQGELINVGIVGPATQALSENLCQLPIDDIYAAYAGWHAEHNEIFSVQIQSENQDHRVEIARFVRRLTDAGFEGIEPRFIGSFFGERCLVAQAYREKTKGTVVVDPTSESWFAEPMGDQKLTAETCYEIVKGRKLLRSFN